jgi:hypothetical protein
VLDGIEFERRGIPAAVVCTDQFVSSARTMSRIQGIPGYPVIFTPHPLSSLTAAEVAARARQVAPQALEILRSGSVPEEPSAESPASAGVRAFADYAEAVEFYQRQGWTDGLPIVLPTSELVAAFLEAGRRPPDETIGVNRVRRRTLTAEKVAVNAVMAGCLAEYAPVVFAVAEAMLDDAFNLHGPAASMAGAAVLVIVNGPVARALGFNSGASIFGPGHRANATVGRTTRLILMNGFGAIPGVFDKSTFGHPGKYAYCIAEDEESAPDWEPLHALRGAPRETSAVTVAAAMSPFQIFGDFPDAPALLDHVSQILAVLATGQSGNWVLVISPENVGHLRRGGFDKRTIREWIVEKSAQFAGRVSAPTRLAAVQGSDYAGAWKPLADPDNLLVLVGGGGAGPGCALIPPWGTGRSSVPVTRIIS